jgi:hypothetical protein
MAVLSMMRRQAGLRACCTAQDHHEVKRAPFPIVILDQWDN